MATSNYPSSLDNYSTLPSSGTPITVSSHYFGPAITNIEAELGTDPAGYATDLKTRLSDINPSEGNLNLDAGYGSKAPIYGVRAWVNFDGTTNVSGNCTIRASGNVSSVTDNATGDYTINFTSALPDVNYAAVGTAQHASGIINNGHLTGVGTGTNYTTSSYRFYTVYILSGNTSYYDPVVVSVSIIR